MLVDVETRDNIKILANNDARSMKNYLLVTTRAAIKELGKKSDN